MDPVVVYSVNKGNGHLEKKICDENTNYKIKCHWNFGTSGVLLRTTKSVALECIRFMNYALFCGIQFQHRVEGRVFFIIFV